MNATEPESQKHDIKITEKSYKRLNVFSGGYDEWEDWKYDFEIITRAINPSVGDALTQLLKNGVKMTGEEYLIDSSNEPWSPKMRARELYMKSLE